MPGPSVDLSFARPGVLILASPRDAAMTGALLAAESAHSQAVSAGSDLLDRISDDTGALILAEELLTRDVWIRLRRVIQVQPPWSDLPIILISSESPEHVSLKALAPLGNVAVLRRPMDAEALLSAVSAALRARRRQFEVRDLMAAQRSESDRKDQFLAMLAHELRNPLAPIRYAAHLLQTERPRPQEQGTLAGLIDRQVGHMSRIIDQLLDASRLTRGLVRLDPSTFDFTALAQESVEAHAPAARGKAIALVGPGDLQLFVDGDRTRLRQVLDNLIDNAIKFSCEGGQVAVNVLGDGRRVRLEVVDQGEGIDEDVRQHLFEAFVQADKSLARSPGGLGLGLSIARGVARLHDGDVWASSEGPGRGSTFVMELPATSRGARGKEDSPRPEALPREPRPARQDVLVAEDNVDAAEALRMVLEADGYHVHVVHSGPEAVEALGTLRPDALVCDIGLPGLSGYDVARSAPSRHRPKVMVAVTGYAGEENKRLAMDAGFDGHLAKPVEIAKLLKVVGQALRS